MYCFLVLIISLAAFIDLRIRKIPNYLTFPSALAALIFHSLTSGLDGLLFGLEGMFLGIFIFYIPYAFGGMGAGDAKLVGVVGSVLGPVNVIIASVLIALVGGVYALLLIGVHRRYGKGLLVRFWQTLKTFFITRQLIYIPAPENEYQPRLCYGVAIALGTIIFITLESAGYRFSTI